MGPKVTGGPMGASTGSAAPSNSTGSAAGNATPSSSGLFSRMCGWFSVEYYQPYFDVNTETVLERLKMAVSPHKPDMFATTAEAPVDLYGAFWTSLTLIFLIGATSNLNSYFAHSSSKEPWERDYNILSFASSMIIMYVVAVPFLLCGASLYTGLDPRPSLVKMIGIYGYVVVVFIPASVLCVIPSGVVQWIVVVVACLLSGVTLVRNLYTVFGTSYAALSQVDAEAQASLAGYGATATQRPKTSFLLIMGAAGIHGVFSLLLKLYFFQGADLAGTISDQTNPNGNKTL